MSWETLPTTALPFWATLPTPGLPHATHSFANLQNRACRSIRLDNFTTKVAMFSMHLLMELEQTGTGFKLKGSLYSICYENLKQRNFQRLRKYIMIDRR